MKRMKWTPASVGCHWYSGAFTISTYVCGKESGYTLTLNFEVLGIWPTLTAAKRAAARVTTANDGDGLGVRP